MKSLIYIGMDVHKESYSLCSYLPSLGMFFGETKIDANPALIKDYIKEIKRSLENKGIKETEFVTCYEAGCLGFSLYKELTKHNIKCKIVAPTTLAKEPGSSKKKTDRKDAKMLARNLAFGTCSFVHIPDEIDQETREYVRMRMAHKKALKKVKQQILSFTLRCGYKYNLEGKRDYWTKVHIEWLKSLEMSDFLKDILNEYMDTLERLIEKIDRLEGKILERSEEERYKASTDHLACLRGLTKATALTILSEIGDFNRFATPNELCSYLGMVPGENSSGDKNNHLGITKQGNSIVRTQLIESAQSLVRGDQSRKSKALKARQKGQPSEVINYSDKAAYRLINRYHHLIKRGVRKNKAITAIARELACFIWGLMTNNINRRNGGLARA